jgi:RNA recognition motif-containing protein
MNIYVGNLSHQAMDTDLKKLFSEFGAVGVVKVVTDNFTRRSRGFAFVDMEERSQGEKAIESLNKTSFMQQSLIVRESSHTETTKRW